jgi:hypothetical protein
MRHIFGGPVASGPPCRSPGAGTPADARQAARSLGAYSGRLQCRARIRFRGFSPRLVLKEVLAIPNLGALIFSAYWSGIRGDFHPPACVIAAKSMSSSARSCAAPTRGAGKKGNITYDSGSAPSKKSGPCTVAAAAHYSLRFRCSRIKCLSITSVPNDPFLEV